MPRKGDKPSDAAAAELLARRPYSCGEIADKLAKRGYSKEEIDRGIGRLKELGILNDLEYARLLSAFCSGKHKSLRAFKEELYRRKVEKEAAEIALEEYPTADEAIDALIRKKLGSNPPTRESLAKIGSFLRARGFDYQDIKSGLRRISAQITDEEGE